MILSRCVLASNKYQQHMFSCGGGGGWGAGGGGGVKAHSDRFMNYRRVTEIINELNIWFKFCTVVGNSPELRNLAQFHFKHTLWGNRWYKLSYLS